MTAIIHFCPLVRLGMARQYWAAGAHKIPDCGTGTQGNGSERLIFGHE